MTKGTSARVEVDWWRVIIIFSRYTQRIQSEEGIVSASINYLHRNRIRPLWPVVLI